MSVTQEVTDFDAKVWRKQVRRAIRAFILKTGHEGKDFTQEVAAFREAYDNVPPGAFAHEGVHEVFNRLASLAMADPKLFDPTRTGHAQEMQNIAIARCTSIMQIIHNQGD